MSEAPLKRASQSVRLGRQPIFGRKQQLVGYELLYRDSSSGNRASFTDGEEATSNVLINALLEFGLDRVVGKAPAFVNFTRSFLTGEIQIPAERDRLVIEVLEDMVIDDALVAGLWRLSEQGFRIALDDFVYSSAWEPCLEVADIVKLDVMSLSEQEVHEHVLLLKDYGLRLLAEKVENYEKYSLCMELGFDMFQGYYFATPNVLEQKRSTASHSTLLRTLAAVNDATSTPDQIADAITQDVMLTHKVLRYVNSSAFGRRSKVDSVKQSVVYLGKEKLRSLATLLTLTSLEGKPSMLMKAALVRANACQNMAISRQQDNDEAYFTAGLLSMLDALLDRPLKEVLSELPVTQELRDAITSHAGPIGDSLRLTIACERFGETAVDAEAYEAYAQARESAESGEGMAGVLPSEKSDTALDLVCRGA